MIYDFNEKININQDFIYREVGLRYLGTPFDNVVWASYIVVNIILSDLIFTGLTFMLETSA